MINQSAIQSNTGNQYQNIGNSSNQSSSHTGAGVQLLDHSMAFYADPTTVTRTDSFSTSDRYAYSWLNLSNVGATKVMWNWYSPDGNLYFTDSKIINRPLPKATWDSYPIWDGMVIMGTNAANLPGKWHVDVYVGDQKILTEQFAIG